MPLVTKYYDTDSTTPKLDVVCELARQDGLLVVAGSPGFCIWYCIKFRGARRLIQEAIARLEDAGVVFEKRKPQGAFECEDP